jgi:transcriptional regulator with XRE-family HTH domain
VSLQIENKGFAVKLELGKAIRLVRNAQGMGLAQVAKKAKVGVPFLSLMERGKRSPSLETLRKIAKALSVPPEALVLLAGTAGTLRTDDETISDLAESVQRLAIAEESLRNKLRSTRR